MALLLSFIIKEDLEWKVLYVYVSLLRKLLLFIVFNAVLEYDRQQYILYTV